MEFSYFTLTFCYWYICSELNSGDVAREKTLVVGSVVNDSRWIHQLMWTENVGKVVDAISLWNISLCCDNTSQSVCHMILRVFYYWLWKNWKGPWINVSKWSGYTGMAQSWVIWSEVCDGLTRWNDLLQGDKKIFVFG